MGRNSPLAGMGYLKNPTWGPLCLGEVGSPSAGLWRWEALPTRDFVFALEEPPVPGSVDGGKAVVA